MLRVPLLVELFGAGFTKARRAKVCRLRKEFLHKLNFTSSTTSFGSLELPKSIVRLRGAGGTESPRKNYIR